MVTIRENRQIIGCGAEVTTYQTTVDVSKKMKAHTEAYRIRPGKETAQECGIKSLARGYMVVGGKWGKWGTVRLGMRLPSRYVHYLVPFDPAVASCRIRLWRKCSAYTLPYSKAKTSLMVSESTFVSGKPVI